MITFIRAAGGLRGGGDGTGNGYRGVDDDTFGGRKSSPDDDADGEDGHRGGISSRREVEERVACLERLARECEDEVMGLFD